AARRSRCSSLSRKSTATPVISGSLVATVPPGCHDDQMVAPDTRRRRDPERRERILAAAARLAAGRGFHTVGRADIGAQAGIVGSGIYRHFASKDALLVALLDRGMDRLAEGAATILAAAPDGHAALSALVRDHIAVAIEERAVLAVYHREIYTLPEEDRRRLRRRERHIVRELARPLAAPRPSLTR